ncbi:receptor-like protein EIX2 [Malania oleifera]|uniref:receptor-like protein EIX2 n=1 Tax=Malania oleifera TaxID=397392 RepID=UPI0025AE744A|nr:receptor-like protein EIX2 [Malania oleifera]
MISEAHLSNLSRLRFLDLSYNPLALNLSFDWLPPFKLDIIHLSGCKLGPHFPEWLKTQNNCSELDISGARISDVIPNWFWELSPRLSLLNLSYNQIDGLLPNLSVKFQDSIKIDLSSNNFCGAVMPSLFPNVSLLDLSKNKFNGSVSFLCKISGESLLHLDLSDNLLLGDLPNCWMHLKKLSVFHLQNNKLSGNIPSSMGSLFSIYSLRLRNNDFTGELPSSFQNCTSLTVLDLGENQFSGIIPAWIGDSLLDLVVLSLRDNQFYGTIPQSLCYLSHIQILDLSLNNISGNIPKCINNFTTMAQANLGVEGKRVFLYSNSIANFYWNSHGDLFYEMVEDAFLGWKGKELEYKNAVRLVKSLDLSSNKLTGEIPSEITCLEGLVGLNLSRNSMKGSIPSNIGRMRSLDFLDLSMNHLAGEIPASLSQINRLGVLDLSCNNLSGKIPRGTQLQGYNASVYMGNPQLCGLPLLKRCPGDEVTQDPPSTGGNEDNRNTQGDEAVLGIFPWYYYGMGLGFAVGFFGVCGTLVLKSSWRNAYFEFLNSMKDRIYVMLAIYLARFWRRLKNHRY